MEHTEYEFKAVPKPTPIRVMAFETQSVEVVIIGEKIWTGKRYGRDRDETILRALKESGLLVIIDPLAKPEPRPEASVQDGAHGVGNG